MSESEEVVTVVGVVGTRPPPFLYLLRIGKDRPLTLSQRRSGSRVPVRCLGDVCCLRELLRRAEIGPHDRVTYLTAMEMGESRCGRGVHGDLFCRFVKCHTNHLDEYVPCNDNPVAVGPDHGHTIGIAGGDGVSDAVYCGMVNRPCCPRPGFLDDLLDATTAGTDTELGRLVKRDSKILKEEGNMGQFVWDDGHGRYVYYCRSHPGNPYSVHYL